MSKNLGSSLNFFLFICFCSGIAFGHFFSNFLAFSTLALISLSLTYFFYRKTRLFISDICILISFLFLGALWQVPFSHQKLDRFLHKGNQFTLKVVSLPKESANRNTSYAVLKEAGKIPFNKKIKVADFTKNMEYLSSYRVAGRLTRRKYKSRDFYTLWVKKGALIEELPLNPIEKGAKAANRYLLRVFKNNLDELGERFLASVFLGRREMLGDEKEILTNAGVAHLLAISGLHMGLTALILFFILRFFHINFRLRLITSLVFLYFYTFLTGASPSTLRAVIMYSVFALSFFIRRKVNPLNSLALAGFAMLIMNPLALFNIGFQLSFSAVFAIILGFKIFNVKSASKPSLNYLKYIFFCSFFVTLLLTPLISYYFGKVYILSVLYNVVLIPIFTFILILNFLLIIFSPFSFIAQSIGHILSLLISCFIKLVHILGSVKFSFVPYTFSPKLVAVYYLFLVGILVLLAAKKNNALSRSS